MFLTGQTIYELIVSVDTNNDPITGATFTTYVFKDGSSYSGITLNISLTHAPSGIFTSSWSADTVGDYQFYYKNDTTNSIFISNVYIIRTERDFSQTIYVGL